MAKIGAEGISLVKRFEGFSSRIYIDLAGHLTVGYGHKILSREKFSEPVLEAQAEELLRKDLCIAEECASRIVTTELQQHEFDALVSLVFNIGCGRFCQSTLCRLLNEGQKPQAADQFTRWVFVKGKKIPGLVRRREAERKLFLGVGSEGVK